MLHWLKDITQDILVTPTVLDRMGNIQENISWFPKWLVWFYHWAWVNAFFMQIALLVMIPKRWFAKQFNKQDWIVLVIIGYIVIMLIISLFLA